MFDYDKELKKCILMLESSIRFKTPISEEFKQQIKDVMEHELLMNEINRKHVYSRTHGHG